MKTNYLYEQKVLPEIGTMIKERSPYMHTFLPIKPSQFSPLPQTYQRKQQSKIEKEEENINSSGFLKLYRSTEMKAREESSLFSQMALMEWKWVVGGVYFVIFSNCWLQDMHELKRCKYVTKHTLSLHMEIVRFLNFTSSLFKLPALHIKEDVIRELWSVKFKLFLTSQNLVKFVCS